MALKLFLLLNIFLLKIAVFSLKSFGFGLAAVWYETGDLCYDSVYQKTFYFSSPTVLLSPLTLNELCRLFLHGSAMLYCCLSILCSEVVSHVQRGFYALIVGVIIFVRFSLLTDKESHKGQVSFPVLCRNSLTEESCPG